MIQIQVHWICLFKLMKEVGYHKYCWDSNLTYKIMCEEGIELKELTHTDQTFILVIQHLLQYLLVYYICFYVEIKVRRSKYSMMVFLEPNRTKLVLPPLPHWWVLMRIPHRKWKLTKKFVFPIKVFQPWPWLACCMCEGAWCVCPHIWRGMAGERIIRNMHQGEASSAIAKTELQEHCLPVLHIHIREWSVWSPSPAELLEWKGLCRGQWPSSWMSEAGWMCENKIHAIVTPFFAGS